MKIEKINDHQIRCTLTSEDLASRNIKLSELAYGSEKARSLFRDMMEQAAMDFGFEAEDIPIMVEAVPLSSEKIVLIITKVDSPDELDTRFSNFTQFETEEEENENGLLSDNDHDVSDFSPEIDETASQFLQLLQHLRQEQNKEKAEISKVKSAAQTLPTDMVRIFHFRNLDSAINAAHALHGFYQGKNTLYKDAQENTYHLIVHQSQHSASEFNRVNNMLCSYLQPGKYTAGIQAYFEEHFRKIINGNALQQLNEIA
ncbi:adaptor protein MecA [uncultured Eubacterium sp.]|uniref:adaptor protein MecA n=1 Tax=uncultured Eubacterium sp. TaxID=165185 RepID=UPI0025DAFE42|nr:adaptor protein MecA [uncultured Eubacterium sp.]